MSVYVEEKQVLFDGTIITSATEIATEKSEGTHHTMEAEKRIRREIANSNERRRMQSINNGFQSLRSLLPHHEGEKLSKAAILQQTAEYIYTLEQEKTSLLSQNCQLKRLVNQHEGGDLPPKKRKADAIIMPNKCESSDEGLGSMSPEPVKVVLTSINQSESMMELKQQLAQERNMRIMLEEQVRQLEGQLYQQQQIYEEQTEEIVLPLVEPDHVPPVGHTQIVICSPAPSRSPSPAPVEVIIPEQQPRLPSVLEAAIKAEPKVEVERLPSPNLEENAGGQRIYVSNRSRQNLETIVEAIRHLEGDHMFGDDPLAQEAPLALTKRTAAVRSKNGGESIVKIELTPVEIQSIRQQQSRPGVIVGKQSSTSS